MRAHAHTHTHRPRDREIHTQMRILTFTFSGSPGPGKHSTRTWSTFPRSSVCLEVAKHAWITRLSCTIVTVTRRTLTYRSGQQGKHKCMHYMLLYTFYILVTHIPDDHSLHCPLMRRQPSLQLFLLVTCLISSGCLGQPGLILLVAFLTRMLTLVSSEHSVVLSASRFLALSSRTQLALQEAGSCLRTTT